MFDPELFEKTRKFADPDSFEKLATKLASSLKWSQNCSVLDYGCGPGSTAFHYLLPKVKQHNGEIYGVDVSEEMIEFAKMNFSSEKIFYSAGNILNEREIFLKGKLFDNVFSLYVMNHIKDYRRFIRNIHRVLKPGGVFAFVTLTNGVEFRVQDILRQNVEWANYFDGYENYVPDWMKFPLSKTSNPGNDVMQTLVNVGFDILEFSKHSYHCQYDDLGLFSEFLLSLNPMLQYIPGKLKPTLLQEYYTILEKAKYVENSKFFENEMIFCVCKKV